ncbi:NlpC/P60 family protein [Pseudonocardia broussonetiae]|uniref:NlpC/P60 family protein n=1 Tax=Pseudonocardia broussonetiae TaxID=2736640 RepID=UPI001962C9DB|nr:NlpC/P60 family protein [Pseudonocardia broussonetiae]
MTVALIGVGGILVGVVLGPLIAMTSSIVGGADAEGGRDDAPALPSSDQSGFVFTRLDNPGRTVVTDQQDVIVATLTDGARTTTIAGPVRTFSEPRYTHAAVQTATWVRIAPQPWHPGAEQQPWVRPWLAAMLVDTSPDVLAVATEYMQDAPDVVDDDGLRIAGNASFGPEISETRRAIGADFYDYLGVPWEFADGVSKEPEDEQYSALDCSGYLRLVYGYRQGYPLQWGSSPGPGLPRRANDMATVGPGTMLIPDRGERPTELDRLQAGDLLFFTTDDEPDIDHSGIYLGRDTDGLHRFISSRATPNGPTLGDMGGASVLDGDGFFAERFRTARRL